MGSSLGGLVTLMRIYFLVAQWIGCLPFKMDYQTFKSSVSGLRSSLCLIIPNAMLIVEIYVTEILGNSGSYNYDVAIQFFRKTSFMIHYGTCAMIFIVAFVKRNSHMEIAEKYIAFTKRYGEDYKFSEGSTKSISLLVFFMLIPQILPCFKLLYDIVDILSGNYGTVFNIMFIAVSYIYTIPIISFLCLSFFFERFNTALEKIKQTDRSHSCFGNIRLAYAELFEILEKLNESLDLQLSLLYVHLFSRYIVISFDLIYSVFVDKSRSLVYSDVTRQSAFLLKFYTLSQAGDMVTSEAGNIGAVLHKVAFENKNADDDFKDDIQLFSLSLLHYKKEPKIMGYMNIDYTLLFSVIAAVVSYCFIVSQFQTPITIAFVRNYTHITTTYDNLTTASP